MIWTVKNLSADYKRSFIGYDVRIKDGYVSPKTLSPEIWPKNELLDGISLELETNGLNLLNSCRSVSGLLSSSALVAFDIPEQLANSISHTFGLQPSEQAEVPKKGEWEFLGFDIVDPRTQSSALYDFPGFDNITNSVFKNKSGLIDDISQSINLSIAFDLAIKEHAPFVPCGVWIFKAMDD